MKRAKDPTRMFVHKQGCAELPWRVSEFKGDEPYNAHIMPAEGHLPVANIVGIRVGARESAAFIVNAANNHPALLAMVEQFVAIMDSEEDGGEGIFEERLERLLPEAHRILKSARGNQS